MLGSEGRRYAEQTIALVDRLLARVEGLAEDIMRRKPSEHAWSVMEILCHVEEILDYWPSELVRVIEANGGEWGRGLQDERRLAAVARANERMPDDVVQGIRLAAATAQNRLLKLADEDFRLQAPHRNPKFGVKPMKFLADHFIIEHLEGHIGQIDRTLAAIG